MFLCFLLNLLRIVSIKKVLKLLWTNLSNLFYFWIIPFLWRFTKIIKCSFACKQSWFFTNLRNSRLNFILHLIYNFFLFFYHTFNPAIIKWIVSTNQRAVPFVFFCCNEGWSDTSFLLFSNQTRFKLMLLSQVRS